MDLVGQRSDCETARLFQTEHKNAAGQSSPESFESPFCHSSGKADHQRSQIIKHALN